MSEAFQIYQFMKTIEKLCSIKRDILLHNGEVESDADHIFKLTFLAMMVSPYLKGRFDHTKLLEIALVHDIAEAVVGDYPLAEQSDELKERKKQEEIAAVEQYKNMLPPPLNEKIYDLFYEYETQSSPEAKVIKALDKIEARMQSHQYNDGDISYWADCPNGDWYYEYCAQPLSTITSLRENILDELDEISIRLTQENMHKCNIKIG